MRVYSFFICFTWLLVLGSALAEVPSDLGAVLLDYQTLQKEVDDLLKIKKPDCLPNPSADEKNFCELKNYCELKELHKDDPLIYQNEQGEKIVNDEYYEMRNNITSCLREKFADEIKEKKEELSLKLGNEHLKKILAANKLLSAQVSKYGQGNALSRISMEITNITLEAGLNAEAPVWGNKSSESSELLAVIALAEKRTRLKLNPEIKKTLIAIEQLKLNPSYKIELEKFESRIIPESTPKDPFYDWSQLLSEKAAGGTQKLKLNRQNLQQKSQDVYNVFEETRSDLLIFLNEKKNEKNSKQIERIIERVKTIKFNTPRLTAELKENCKYPNAFYNSRNHSFTICPQFLNFPRISLKETIAHEIAHSFDSCNLSGNFYKSMGPEIVEDAPFEVDIKKSPVLGNFRNTRGEEPKELKAKNKIQEKMLYADNPFSKTLSCLTDPRSVGALTPDLNELKRKALEELALLTKQNQNNDKNAKARGLNYFINNADDYFSYFEGCNNSNFGDSLGRSQMQEAFADKISSEIISRDLAHSSALSAKTKVLEIALGYGNVCPNETAVATKFRDFAVKNGCGDFIENMSNEKRILSEMNLVDPAFNPHPEVQKRLENSLMAHPTIRRVLQCPTDKGVKYCE